MTEKPIPLPALCNRLREMVALLEGMGDEMWASVGSAVSTAILTPNGRPASESVVLRVIIGSPTAEEVRDIEHAEWRGVNDDDDDC